MLTSAANTGIPVAPTADGTFPVYLRYQFQIMRGINPDGSSYADPVTGQAACRPARPGKDSWRRGPS